MINFMQCYSMMFGPKVKYCVTYRNNELDFNVYTRKFEHDYRVFINNKNFEGGKGLEI